MKRILPCAAVALFAAHVLQPMDEDKNDEAFIDSIDKKWSGALPGLFLYDHAGGKVASFIGETDIAEIEKAVAAQIGSGCPAGPAAFGGCPVMGPADREDLQPPLLP
jgi:hypothetical protein